MPLTDSTESSVDSIISQLSQQFLIVATLMDRYHDSGIQGAVWVWTVWCVGPGCDTINQSMTSSWHRGQAKLWHQSQGWFFKSTLLYSCQLQNIGPYTCQWLGQARGYSKSVLSDSCTSLTVVKSKQVGFSLDGVDACTRTWKHHRGDYKIDVSPRYACVIYISASRPDYRMIG